jgi:hypothetical protein
MTDEPREVDQLLSPHDPFHSVTTDAKKHALRNTYHVDPDGCRRGGNTDNASPRSTERLPGLLGSHVFHQWFIGYVLVALLWFAVKAYDRQQENAEERGQINQVIEDTRKAVRRGETGDAFRQLFPDDHENVLDDQRKQNKNIGAARADR